MKILSAAQIREADSYTIKNESIKSIELMERAANAFSNFFINKFDSHQKVLIIAGNGNNGGDALAIARLLQAKSYAVEVCLAMPIIGGSPDFKINLERLPKSIQLIQDIEKATDFDVIIDGLFGSGLTRPIKESLGLLVDKLNASEKKIISIDIASGLNCDGIAKGNRIIKPTDTISFQLPKLAFMLPDNNSYVGNWHLVDIGLDRHFMSNTSNTFNYQTEQDIAALISHKNKFSHKRNFGHALLVGGSHGKIGAIVLASKAALRAGSGLATALLPSCGYEIIQTSVPEVMCLTNGDRKLETIEIGDVYKYSAIGIGPGLGKSAQVLSTMLGFIKSYKNPMVLDADAINLLADNPELLELLPEQSILTPHVGEFNRLVGDSCDGFERLNKQIEFSEKYKLVLVLKGAHSSISDTEGAIWFNSTGNPGMATAGSGDVLTGVITGLLAQGYTPIHAARIGVFIHGRAGDYAKDDLGEISMIASDIIERISKGFISIV